MDHYAASRENLPHQRERRGQTKIGVKQIQDGGRPPSWKYINGCISVISGPIYTNFGLQIDIRHTRVIGVHNYIFKNSRWRRIPSGIFDFWPYLRRQSRHFCQIRYSDRYWPDKGYCSEISHLWQNSRWMRPPS